MKLSICAFFIMLTLTPFAYGDAVQLSPYQESQAYKTYQRRPKTELSKLVYVMDRYKSSDYKVIFDKVEYDSLTALKYAKNYVAKHYKKQNAEDWIKDHAYRSPSGQVIYLKEPSGKTKNLRDALIEELQPLA